MPKVQVKLDKQEDHVVRLYMVAHDLNSKEAAIKYIIKLADVLKVS